VIFSLLRDAPGSNPDEPIYLRIHSNKKKKIERKAKQQTMIFTERQVVLIMLSSPTGTK